MISSLCFGWCGFFCREKRSIVAVKLVIVFLSNVKRLEKKWMHIRKMEKKKHKMINRITMTKKRKQGICWMIHHRRRKWSLSLTKLIEAVCHLQTKRSYQFLVLRYRETLTFQQVVSFRICANVRLFWINGQSIMLGLFLLSGAAIYIRKRQTVPMLGVSSSGRLQGNSRFWKNHFSVCKSFHLLTQKQI